MKNVMNILFTIFLVVCLLSSAKSITSNSLTVFSWDMETHACVLPKCKSWRKDSVDKLISFGDKYDIICLQGFLKSYIKEQKTLVDKLINDFILKYKYSIFRSKNQKLAILSKFPIEEKGQLYLSPQQWAQRILIKAGGIKIQVFNFYNSDSIPKTLEWMTSPENQADLSVLAGDVNLNKLKVENIIKDMKPFGLDGIPQFSCPWLGLGQCIYVWGDPAWPFTMEKMPREENYYGSTYASIYTKTFETNYQYTQNKTANMSFQTSKVTLSENTSNNHSKILQTYNSLTVLSWNMGDFNCTVDEQSSDCPSYLAIIDKLNSFGDKYDILCIQRFPQFDKSQRKAIDKLTDNFVGKYKYRIQRKNNSNLAIFSKFPIEEVGQLNLTQKYGAQRILVKARGKRIQVVNIHNDHGREDGIRKTIEWMSSDKQKADTNILAGDINMIPENLDDIISDMKPFGLNGVPTHSCPQHGQCIYVWGESRWPFTIQDMADLGLSYGLLYTKTFETNYSYTPNRAVTISTHYSSSETVDQGVNATLVSSEQQDKLSVSQSAWFGTAAHLASHPNDRFKFILEQPSNTGFRISSPFDRVIYLCFDDKVMPDTLMTPQALEWTVDCKFDSKFVYDSTAHTFKSAGSDRYLFSDNFKMDRQSAVLGFKFQLKYESRMNSIYIKDI